MSHKKLQIAVLRVQRIPSQVHIHEAFLVVLDFRREAYIPLLQLAENILELCFTVCVVDGLVVEYAGAFSHWYAQCHPCIEPRRGRRWCLLAVGYGDAYDPRLDGVWSAEMHCPTRLVHDAGR